MKIKIINFPVLGALVVLLSACHKPVAHQNKRLYFPSELSAATVSGDNSREVLSVSQYKKNNDSRKGKFSHVHWDSVGEAQIFHDVMGKHSKNTMLNFLLPIRDSGAQVLFTQLGMHYTTSNKKILNLGGGSVTAMAIGCSVIMHFMMCKRQEICISG